MAKQHQVDVRSLEGYEHRDTVTAAAANNQFVSARKSCEIVTEIKELGGQYCVITYISVRCAGKQPKTFNSTEMKQAVEYYNTL